MDGVKSVLRARLSSVDPLFGSLYYQPDTTLTHYETNMIAKTMRQQQQREHSNIKTLNTTDGNSGVWSLSQSIH